MITNYTMVAKALSIPRFERGTFCMLGRRHDQLDHTDRTCHRRKSNPGRPRDHPTKHEKRDHPTKHEKTTQQEKMSPPEIESGSPAWQASIMPLDHGDEAHATPSLPPPSRMGVLPGLDRA